MSNLILHGDDLKKGLYRYKNIKIKTQRINPLGKKTLKNMFCIIEYLGFIYPESMYAIYNINNRYYMYIQK